MKKIPHLIIVTFLMCMLPLSSCLCQSTENERLKEALERAFAAKPSASPSKSEQESVQMQGDESGILYYVQLFYSKVPADAEQKKASVALGKITRYMHNGLYKYCAGGYPSKTEADTLVHKAKQAGYKSAFVIALKDGKRVDVK